MPSLRAVWFVAAMLAAVARGMSAEPLPALEEKWRYYRSPNFELYSCGAEKESRDYLWYLELLRSIFFDRFQLIERSRLDLTAFHFSKPEHFAAYGPGIRGAAAYHLSMPDRAVMVIGPTPSVEAAHHLVLHEYTHHLFRATDQEPMMWFNEGVAELLATLRINKGKLEVGHARPGILYLLQSQKLLPFETIFAVDRSNPIYRGHTGQSMFYAQSWALLHYLHFGQTDLPREGVNRFVRVVGDARAASRVDLAQLFRECLGMDYAQMQQRIDRYVVNGKYRYGLQSIPAIPAAASYAMRPVPPAEAQLRLAELALRVKNSPAAKLALLEAAQAPQCEARVHEVLGAAALAHDKEPRTAIEQWEQALALGSENVAVHRELGVLESSQWLGRTSLDFRLTPDVATRLRERLRRSIAAVPAQSTAYETLALVEAFADQPNIEHVNLVQEHFRQLKHKHRTLVALALVRARLGKPDEARALLDELKLLPPDDQAATLAAAVRAQLERPQPTGR